MHRVKSSAETRHQAAEPLDGGVDYVVERVEPAPNPISFGHAWAWRT
jgi:hypothetical protein